MSVFRGGTAPAPSLSRRSRYRPSRRGNGLGDGHNGMSGVGSGAAGPGMGLGATSPEAASGTAKADDDLLSLTGIHGLRATGSGDTGHDSGLSRRAHHHGRTGHGTVHHGSTTGSHSGSRASRASPGRTTSHKASPPRPIASRQAGGHTGYTGHGSLHRSHGHHGHHGHAMRRLATRGTAGAGTMVATGTSLNGAASSPPQASSNGGGSGGAKPDTAATKGSPGTTAGRRRRHGSARPSRSKPSDAKRHLAPIPRISSAHFTRPSAAVVDGQPSPTRLERMARLMEPSGVITESNRPPSRQKNAFPTHLSEFDKAKPKDAFTTEDPRQGTAGKERMLFKRHADESPRPPSRHKPPPQALFLETATGARHADDLVLTSPGPTSPTYMTSKQFNAFANVISPVQSKPKLASSSSTGGIAMGPKSVKKRVAASSRHAAWAIDAANAGNGTNGNRGASDDDSDGFGAMPVTYNIPIAVSGASPDAKALDDDLDAPLLDMQQLDETPVSWLRRGTGTAPTAPNAVSHGPAFLLEESFDNFDTRTPRSARLSSLESADADMRRWEKNIAHKYRVSPRGQQGGSSSGAGVAGPTSFAAPVAKAMGQPPPTASGSGSGRGTWTVGPRREGSASPVRDRDVVDKDKSHGKSHRSRPRSGRTRPRSDSLPSSPPSDATRRPGSRLGAATPAAITLSPDGGDVGPGTRAGTVSGSPGGAFSHTGGGRGVSSSKSGSTRRLGRQRSAKSVLERAHNAPSTGTHAPGHERHGHGRGRGHLVPPGTSSRVPGKHSHNHGHGHGHGHGKEGGGGGSGRRRGSNHNNASTFGSPVLVPKAGRRSHRSNGDHAHAGKGASLQPLSVSPDTREADGGGADAGAADAPPGDGPAVFGGRRQFGPPPTTPLTVPFTSTLSQDFLDLFAHSIPSSPGKAKGSGPSDFPLG